MVGASFFIADGVQTVAAGALRGLNDTRVPLLFSAICFWLIGFTACYGLGFVLGFGTFGDLDRALAVRFSFMPCCWSPASIS